MSGYALLTILNPQPDDSWDGHESLGKILKKFSKSGMKMKLI